MAPARLKAQIYEIKEQPEVHPANVEAEAQEAVEQLEELVAAIKRDPTYFARFREDIDIESIRDKQQLYRKRLQGQQTSGFGEIEGQSESIEEEDDDEDESEDEDEEDDGDD
ncbi:hypothetical protein DFQ26_000553 [Actinomortierella ambigua]|nr:hypothetical protein DFQ26_000553 [Actinomortierella ambigua]